MYFALTLLALLGLFVSITGAIQILYVAFVRGIGWGLFALFIPFGFVIFAFMNLKACKRSLVLVVVGMLIAASVWLALPLVSPA